MTHLALSLPGWRVSRVPGSPAVMVLVGLCAVLAVLPRTGGGPPVDERWHVWPIDRVFPADLSVLAPSGARATYRRLGVAPEGRCDQVLDPAVAVLLAPFGCRTILRATYTDSTQTFVVTTGIAVLADARFAHRTVAGALAGRAGSRPHTVRPMAVPSSAADEFGDAQYVCGAIVAGADRYVVLTAAGYADGRVHTGAAAPDPRLDDSARDLAAGLYRELTR